MSSAVDICNLGLAHIGNAANVQAIDPPDGSVEAEHCARFYPMARDVVLESHTWRFATKRIALALLDTDELPGSWQFAYALPNLCLRPVSVLMPGATSDTDTQDFVVEALQNGVQVIYTNTEEATLRYVARITDTAKFTPLVVQSMSRLLASYLAGPITKDPKLIEAQYKLYVAENALAKAADANARKSNAYGNFTPGGIAARQ